MINRSPNTKFSEQSFGAAYGESFGDLVRARRLESGISLKDFAKLLDVSPAYWSCVETNKDKPPVNDLIEKAAKALGDDADTYFIRARRLPPDMTDPKALEAVIRYYRKRAKSSS
jgi:transcriptional regulator with XRE-family HTH domain